MQQEKKQLITNKIAPIRLSAAFSVEAGMK